MVCRLLIYHVKPMLICHLIATMRGSYNTGATANLNSEKIGWLAQWQRVNGMHNHLVVV